MRVAMLTREYPPEIYGGAGVHVTNLVEALRRSCHVDVHCMGAPRPGAQAHQADPALWDANPALTALSADLTMAGAVGTADITHSHTWYTALAGRLAALLHDIPHVLTAHSLEPLRPWKAEQLGGGYRVSSWAEREATTAADAVIAVSSAMREDLLRVYPDLRPDRVHVIYSGIDTDAWRPQPIGLDSALPAQLGIDPDRPTVVFVGRITRQKGVAHLVAAAHRLHPDAQLVLCAGAPDTPEIAGEVTAAVAALTASRSGVFWIQETLPVRQIRELLSTATVFVCPSTYEPLGIVNLEAMACATAVVASDVGGIPEVVDDGVTGSLVHFDDADPAGFRDELAEAINALVTDPQRARRYGAAGRLRCEQEFSWAKVAEQTLAVYRQADRLSS